MMDDNTTQYDELERAITRFRIPLSGTTCVYTQFDYILQDGPQCGLVALGMCLKMSKQEINELYNHAKDLDFTYNGEILNAEHLYALAQKFTTRKVELYTGSFGSEQIKNFLLNKGIALVPYDVDANHSPCLKNGHKAHWALVCGIILCDDMAYIIARQGKSKYLGIWPLEEMAKSNSQLNEFLPSEKHTDLEYKIPEGGISGHQGLKNKCVLIYEQ